MSVHLPQADAPLATEPVSVEDLLAYFHAGAKPRSDWRVGAEFEKFAIERGTGRHLTYGEPHGIRAILESLADRFGWEPHFEGDHLTTLSRAGAVISLEPGGQVEFSTPPLAALSELSAALETHRREIRAVTDPDAVAWIASGVAPFRSADEIPLGPRPRHRIMADYLPARCPMALEMMKATASTQVAFDYSSESDAMRKFRVALLLSPVVNSLWANSPYYAGRPTGFASSRSRIWRGMDPDRSGLLPDFLSAGPSFENWVRYLLDVPMLFICHDGHYSPAEGQTFRQYLAEGHEGYRPTLADWEIHLTTVFPEVRLKHFLEVRGADATGPALAVAVAALWKGLLYDEDALADVERIAEAFRPHDLPPLFAAVGRTGLATAFEGTTVLELAKRIVGIAAQGLEQQGERDAPRFLEPVRAILRVGESPGTALLRRSYEAKPTYSELVSLFEY